MIRLLLVLAALAAALWFLRGLLRAGRRSTAGAPPVPVRTVACARCGVYVPAAEALVAAGRSYCCAEHRDAGPP